MNRDAVITFAQGAFTCEMGAPWRWADVNMSKVYRTIEVKGPDESMCASKMINALTKMKQEAGYKYQHQPRLWWRWDDKVRFEDGVMTTRVYLDGNPPYEKSNPSKPKGRPTVGQVRLVA